MVYSMSFVMPYEQWQTARALDGDAGKIELAGPDNKEKRRLQILNKRSRFLIGMKIKGDHVPTVWQWASSRPLLDCDSEAGFPLIHDKMKSIIEGLEPDVHQFFPVQVVDKKKQPMAERWLWNVCNRIDSVDRVHTTFIQRRGGQWSHSNGVEASDLPPGYDRSVEAKLVFSVERVGGRHFWRDPNLKRQRLLCSEAAGEALLPEEFTGLKLTAMESG